MTIDQAVTKLLEIGNEGNTLDGWKNSRLVLAELGLGHMEMTIKDDGSFKIDEKHWKYPTKPEQLPTLFELIAKMAAVHDVQLDVHVRRTA